MSSMIPRPLKLRMGKKSGRYDLSQDIYVLSIFVGDNLLAQCTLTSDSTAHKCVFYLREKIELQQVQFFALRYHMKCTDPDRRMLRWVEMDKPLRKQLEKWACKPRQVQLAILFHTPNVFALSDPTARSLYYNLLKLDVTHGRFAMDMDKYINLAAYSMQVEYGDFNSEVHTMEFLRALPLLPSNLYRSSQLMDDFLLRILTVYERLTGMQPSYAAFLYIVDAQQCEGYGEEFFTAKDDESTEVQVGYSPDGLVVKRCHSSNLKFRWQDVKDICATKRTLHVKCKLDTTSGVFTLCDSEMARYVAMVLCWQWQYALVDAIQHKAVPMSINNLQGAIRTFGQQPRPAPNKAKLDVHSVRTSSFDLAASGSSNTAQLMPFCAPTNSASSSTVSNGRYAPSLGAARGPPALHAAQSFQHPPGSSAAKVSGRHRSATTASSAQHPAAASAAPSAPLQPGQPGAAAGPYAKQPVVYRPSGGRTVDPDPNTTPVLVPAYATPQFEHRPQHNNLQKTMGSSPEIHLVEAHPQRQHGNSHFMRRAQSNFRNQRTANLSDEKFLGLLDAVHHRTMSEFQFGTPQHALSTPDLALKWVSTPDLISTVLVRQPAAGRDTRGGAGPRPELQPHASSTSSGSSSGRIAHRLAAAAGPAGPSNGRLFSQGHVVAGQRPPGQPIVYPVPCQGQAGCSREPPPYADTVLLQHQLQHQHRRHHPQQQHSPGRGGPGLGSRPHSAYTSSSASSDSYVRQLNEAAADDSDADSEPEQQPMEPDSRSPSPSEHPDRPGSSSAMNQKYVLQNAVARSGGLAAQQCRPPTASNDETLRMLRERLDTPQAIDAEFAAVPCKRLSAGVSTSQHPENQPRNRKGNVFPYEDTRVQLGPHKHNADGYINASNVHVPVGEHRTLRYIVCQAPMKSTSEDFWQMIWESGARLIVMLVNPNQVAKTDSIPPYWPTKAKEKLALADFLVKTQSSTTTKFQTTSVLSLKHLRSGERRVVFHLYCADFVADGVPSSEAAFLGFIDAVSSVKRLIDDERAKETDSGVFSLLRGRRSRSGSRANLADLTNRQRSQSAEAGWRRKLRLSAAPASPAGPRPSAAAPTSAPVQPQSSRLSDTSDSSAAAASAATASPDLQLDPPTVVHCTDGAAESGLYVLVEGLIQCIENNVGVDVPNMLKSLRQQRMYLVRNVKQYRFAYSLLANFLEQSRLI